MQSPRLHEWLEVDGLGGFASGTVSGIRTRRYHGLLTVATTPPTGRVLLINGFEAWIETPAGTYQISSQMYAGEVLYPAGHQRIESFDAEPWPRWTYACEDGTKIEHELFMAHGSPATAMTWRLAKRRKGATLMLRPLISGRGTHALHHENQDFRFDATPGAGRVTWRPYDGVPGLLAITNGEYQAAPEWYRQFLYTTERERGYDHTEDLASPGTLRFDLSKDEAVVILAAENSEGDVLKAAKDPQEAIAALRKSETRRRRAFKTRLDRSADAYVVARGGKRTIVAGYPWFTDWGRDTFISMRGLCLATGRLEDAEAILLQWAARVSEGQLPNRFTEEKDEPEFNAVDASLWFCVAVHEYLNAAQADRKTAKRLDETAAILARAALAIVDGFAKGTRYGIRMTEDGLLACGTTGVQLTWMDAKVGDWVVTPRIGKPVEVQALWINALCIVSSLAPWCERGEGEHAKKYAKLAANALREFWARFWNPERECLYDVVDDMHRAGENDASLRPNQIFAVGGLPFPVLDLKSKKARAVVDAVEKHLLTPVGLRSLAPDSPAYAPRYEGGPTARDGAYHQGTVWVWLLGAFVEAWVGVRGDTDKARREARTRFLEPLLARLDETGIGHLDEIADGDAPHVLRGAPFQAWSLGEALRLDRVVLAPEKSAAKAKAKPAKSKKRE
jgi:predicted glycogen debranching enzyme